MGLGLTLSHDIDGLLLKRMMAQFSYTYTPDAPMSYHDDPGKIPATLA